MLTWSNRFPEHLIGKVFLHGVEKTGSDQFIDDAALPYPRNSSRVRCGVSLYRWAPSSWSTSQGKLLRPKGPEFAIQFQERPLLAVQSMKDSLIGRRPEEHEGRCPSWPFLSSWSARPSHMVSSNRLPEVTT